MLSRALRLRAYHPIQLSTRFCASFSRKNAYKRGQDGFRIFADGGAHATHNDLPVPQGDWYEDYHTRNTRYNFFLVGGIIALFGSIMLVKTTGLMFFNGEVPHSDDFIDCFCD